MCLQRSLAEGMVESQRDGETRGTSPLLYVWQRLQQQLFILWLSFPQVKSIRFRLPPGDPGSQALGSLHLHGGWQPLSAISIIWIASLSHVWYASTFTVFVAKSQY